MALDAHVIPISAFMVGDYEPGLAVMMRDMGMKNVPAAVIGPGGIERITPPRTLWGRFQLYSGIWALRRAKKRWDARCRRVQGMKYVEWLRDALRPILGLTPDWSEVGGSALTRRFERDALRALQAYALHSEFPDVLKQARPYTIDGVVIGLADATLDLADELHMTSERFRHLFAISDEGFCLPIFFDPPRTLADPFRDQELTVGSSARLLQELEELNEGLRIRQRWDVSGIRLGPSETEDRDLGLVHEGWLLAEGFARVSVEKRLPICFDG